MRLLILVALLSVPACAEWLRLSITSTVDGTDKPPAHPLGYFATDALLRGHNAASDSCAKCTAKEKLAFNSEHKNKAEVHLVGKLAGLLVYDVYYYVGGSHLVESKSIIVK